MSRNLEGKTMIDYSGGDAEEFGPDADEPGYTYFTSTDLELVRDAVGNDKVIGLRFRDITLPKEILVLNCYIQFTSEHIYTGPTNLVLWPQDVVNASAFYNKPFGISSLAEVIGYYILRVRLERNGRLDRWIPR